MNINDSYLLEYSIGCDKTIQNTNTVCDIFKLQLQPVVYEFACTGLITESSVGNSLEKFINTIIEKIKEMKAQLQKLTSNLLNTVKAKQVTNIDEKSLSKEKVKMKDYKALEKLEDETVIKIKMMKSDEEIEAAVKQYKKQRNKILAGGILVAVSLSTALYFVTKGSHKRVEEINKKYQEQTDELNNLKTKYAKRNRQLQSLAEDKKKLIYQNQRLKAKGVDKVKVVGKQFSTEVGTTVNEVDKSIDLTKKKITANMEVLKDAGTTIGLNVKDSVNVLSSPKARIDKKITNTIKSGEGIVHAVKDVASGTTKKELGKDKLKELHTKISEKSNKIEIAKDKVRKMPKGQKRSDAIQMIHKQEKLLEDMKNEYMQIKKAYR